ncbi:unnamed protein product [Lactuca virosa]|uniref:Uncharacterized protein n=1 Tax=Lactuca virosa TaxID=75947 RepID=A0AAU9N3P0_9ASTR|nr:unnamed protein product [Lactuca virosa]
MRRRTASSSSSEPTRIIYKETLVPGLKSYIDAEKQKVVDKLQSFAKSSRDGWRTELPSSGLGNRVLEQMKNEKEKDAAWQGKCSGILEEMNLKVTFRR